MFSEYLFIFMFSETRFEFMFSETLLNFMFIGLMSFGNAPYEALIISRAKKMKIIFMNIVQSNTK